jgi:hypothetical protein
MTHFAKPAPPPSNALLFLLGLACATYINFPSNLNFGVMAIEFCQLQPLICALLAKRIGGKFKPHGVIFHVRASVLFPDGVLFLGKDSSRALTSRCSADGAYSP